MPVGEGGVVHVNVNCTDLDRSLAFYRDQLGLTPVTRTAPTEPQDGGAFGLERAQWDAWMMGGAGGFRAPVVDLLQWIVPTPLARPGQDTVGFRRLHIGGDADPPRQLTDPDGTQIVVRPGGPGVVGVTIGCSDPDRSRRFYEDVVGLTDFVELVPGRGSAPPAANTVGIWRMALGTGDIDADVGRLAAAGVRCVSDVAEMSMGPGLPLLRFVLFPDPDGTMLELIERPAQA